MSFSKELYKLRKERSLSQSELAKELGVSQASINYWEKDQRTPSIDALKKIADYFNVSPEEMLGIKRKDVLQEPELTEHLVMLQNIVSLAFDKLDPEEILQYAYELQFLKAPDDYDGDRARFLSIQLEENEEYLVSKSKLLTALSLLNSCGQQKLISYAKDLAKIPEYQKESDSESHTPTCKQSN